LKFKRLALINKIVGSICLTIGGILIFSGVFLVKDRDKNVFLVTLLGGPVLIYLGLKLLNYI